MDPHLGANMKPLSFLTLAAFVATATSALAEEADTFKEKFHCSIESHVKEYDASGKEIFDSEYAGRSTEGTRVVWKQDGLTYRFSETLHYSFTKTNDGVWKNEPSSKSKSLVKVHKQEKDGLVVYSMERKQVKISLRNKKISESSYVIEDTYSKVGDQEILVKSVVNGKEEPVWASHTSERKEANDAVRVVVETYQVPHYEYDAATKNTSVTLKFTNTCVYEKLAE
jgi:hypothetical protein